ncbi:MAG TPA: ABC transporter permease [Burkholderiales bacterium]|nr:ABC transporter permease [Burkholderiales bacterium]
MVVVAVVVFGLLHLSPGDPAAIIAGDQATTQEIEKVRTQLGLDRPLAVQFASWLADLARGDLGRSIYDGQPVAKMIGQRLEPTIALALCTLLVSVLLSVPLGTIAAWKAGTWIDRTIMGFAVLGFSFPVFVIGYGLIYLFSLTFELLPVQGYASLREGIGEFAAHMVMPSLALGWVLTALFARMTRTSMLEVLGQDYIRTAQAKGLSTAHVLAGHALKNAAVPIVTTIGIGVALLIGGVVVTETVFAIPGVGLLTVDAILRRDYPVIQGVVLVFSAVYVLVNLAVDLSYGLFDPRIRY